MESVYKDIDKEMLPIEYGGTNGHIQDVVGKKLFCQRNI